MEKLAQYNKKIVFKDLDNFYAERETFETEDEWHIYSKEGYYVGYVFLGQGAGITYPKDLNDEPSQWTMKPLEVNNLKNAVRYIYLNWQRINHQNSINEIRKIVREIFMGNDWSEPEWWTKNKWGKDSPGPDPFSPDALGSAVGSAMNTTAEGEEVIPEYWKNGGDEPLSPEPFSDEVLGNYFMPESDGDIDEVP